jgi:hypothetical protein
MHPCVCFEASRLTLTQSSWTTPSQGCSRQWMSGYAAVPLAAPSDRGPRINFTLTALGEPVPPSEGESPFPLDFYLSWMSPIISTLNMARICFTWPALSDWAKWRLPYKPSEADPSFSASWPSNKTIQYVKRFLR